MKDFVLDGENVKINDVWAASQGQIKVKLSDKAKEKMVSSRAYIEKKLKAGETIYGVNTGFGALSSVKISDKDIVQLQKNLIRSHCAGVGAPFSKEESRAIMFLRANALARGHSGIRPLIVEKILEFLNNDWIPVIPQQGSVGASGDLAPLSHLTLALIGEGQFWGEPPKNATYLELQAKEGLSMINGCQVMTAVGMLNAYRSRRLAWLTDLAGAMSLEALKGTRAAFDPLIAATRPHPGEAKTARNILKLLGAKSQISESHEDCDKVQDAYSLRCMPAVHGACKDALRFVVEKLETEANSSTDNPLVFVKEDKILSCGNFHGEPVAFALDFLGIAITAMSSISECRIEKLINPAMSGLPAFLAPNGGLNSGYMIVQVAAASLVSENKILAHPASVDSIPTSADKEDHVSMGTIAARKLGSIVTNCESVVAMEIMAAAQALDLISPLKPASAVEKAFALVRTEVPFAKEDRNFSIDIESVRKMIHDERFEKDVFNKTGELEW
jgi:histidine ammonia-lyase